MASKSYSSAEDLLMLFPSILQKSTAIACYMMARYSAAVDGKLSHMTGLYSPLSATAQVRLHLEGPLFQPEHNTTLEILVEPPTNSINENSIAYRTKEYGLSGTLDALEILSRDNGALKTAALIDMKDFKRVGLNVPAQGFQIWYESLLSGVYESLLRE